jgi:hydrogenase maturation protein HypF
LKNEDTLSRCRIEVFGAVQGVGFRPFIYRLATEIGLKGWVCNSAQGALIEAEGSHNMLQEFVVRMRPEAPQHADIRSVESSTLNPIGYPDFQVRASREAGEKKAVVLPDIAACAECLSDVFDGGNRRYLYPFTNCTNCGPRYSIIETLPYDRARTTMKHFVMCSECRREYENPRDRRFHAQPNACSMCGPQLRLLDSHGASLADRHDALLRAAAAIRTGAIVAMKGIGGFHLIVDAQNADAVARLRERKLREEKPFALMYPDIEMAAMHCHLDETEARLLSSAGAPIVLLRRRSDGVARNVAPANPNLGIMLPYAPLDHILMRELRSPIVATSGNRAGEPICISEEEALERLSGIADFYLTHDRPIARPVDDSIARVMCGREVILRRARGYAPWPVPAPQNPMSVLAVGGHLKNTVALTTGSGIVVSQHIGDLGTAEAQTSFQRTVESLAELYGSRPDRIACDMHPDYASSAFAAIAAKTGLSTIPVQHHYAHILSCMADNELEPPALGVAWDGSGYGLDGTIWGGEFLEISQGSFRRVAHLRTFPLPGGDAAITHPRRAAIGLLYEILGDRVFSLRDLAPILASSASELRNLEALLRREFRSPRCSSAGRLFDAVASIAGIRHRNAFEGQAAMELEFAIGEIQSDDRYDFDLQDSVADWAPMIRGVLTDVQRRVDLAAIAAKFHNTLTDMILSVAMRTSQERVVLSGGCFQNKYLTERVYRLLTMHGFHVYIHRRIPPNDGGIALGQVIAALQQAGKITKP